MPEQLNLFSFLGFESDEEPESNRGPSTEQTTSKLEELIKESTHCINCALQQGSTHGILSYGNPEAKVMYIGNTPEHSKNSNEEPFSGETGPLLTRALNSVNLDLKRDLYFCTLVLCHSPDNHKPLPEEIAQCIPYLEKQIELIKPKILILAGSVALKELLKVKGSLTRLRGKWQSWNEIEVMPILHPADLLRNDSNEVGEVRWLTWLDLKATKKRLDEILTEENNEATY